MIRLPFSLSPGPVNPRRQVPPYLPISWTGLITSGSWLTRSATGGSLPAWVISASIGASLNALGIWEASVTTVGPSSLPINWEPILESAGLAAAGGAAGLVASAGFGASAGFA